MMRDFDAQVDSAPPSRSQTAFALIVGLMVGLVLAGVAGWFVLSHNSGRDWLGRMWSAATGRTLSIDVSQPTVVDRIQRLQRLETVVYTMDKVVTGAKENSILPDFLAGDRLLMLVHGEVVAGIDFSGLKSGDVKVSSRQVRLHLPDCASVQRAARQREDSSIFPPNRTACTYRSKSGNAGASGGRERIARVCAG